MVHVEQPVDSVIVKLGDKGAYWSTGGEHGTVPAFPVKRIVDTVGADDGCGRCPLTMAEGMSCRRLRRARHGNRLDTGAGRQ